MARKRHLLPVDASRGGAPAGHIMILLIIGVAWLTAGFLLGLLVGRFIAHANREYETARARLKLLRSDADADLGLEFDWPSAARHWKDR